MNSLLYLVPLFGAAALAFAFFQAQRVIGAQTGNERMQEIASAISEGAHAFLFSEYRIILPLCLERFCPPWRDTSA